MSPSSRSSMGGRLGRVTLQLVDPWWLTIELEAEKLRVAVARSMPANRAKRRSSGRATSARSGHPTTCRAMVISTSYRSTACSMPYDGVR